MCSPNHTYKTPKTFCKISPSTLVSVCSANNIVLVVPSRNTLEESFTTRRRSMEVRKLTLTVAQLLKVFSLLCRHAMVQQLNRKRFYLSISLKNNNSVVCARLRPNSSTKKCNKDVWGPHKHCVLQTLVRSCGNKSRSSTTSIQQLLSTNMRIIFTFAKVFKSLLS